MSRTGLLLAPLALASMLTAASSALAHPSTLPPAEESAGPTAFGVLPGLAAAIAEEAPNEDWQAVASAGHPAGAAIGLAVAMLVLLAFRRRDALAVATVLASLVLIFENGVHSVHHLGDDQGASECAAAVATTHLAGASTEPPSAEAFHVLRHERLAATTPAIPACQTFRPDIGRAPPM